MQRLTNPIPLFLDGRGALLHGGSIYVGEAGQDPEEHPKALYWDKAGTQLAEQPLKTLAGVVVNEETPASVFFEDGDYSLRIRDSEGFPYINIFSASDLAGADYQPLDSDLTAIAALATTAYGRNLLTLANQAALQAAVGISPGLPTTGGTVTGNILRGSAGSHLYHASAAFTSGRVFVIEEGDPDPSSLPGDIVLTVS